MSDLDLGEPMPEDLNRLVGMLGEPALWAEPSAEVEDAVLAAIAAERTAGRPPQETSITSEPQTVGDPTVVPLVRRPSPTASPSPPPSARPKANRGRLLLAAAAVFLLGAVTGGGILAATGRLGSEGPVAQANRVEVALAGVGQAPAASAVAQIEARENGSWIKLDVTGLDPAPAGFVYEAWLVRDEPRTRITAGTFHMRGGDGDLILWSGVLLDDFPTVTVTLESVEDPSTDSQLVLRGRFEGTLSSEPGTDTGG
jgi:hypothetical protein